MMLFKPKVTYVAVFTEFSATQNFIYSCPINCMPDLMEDDETGSLHTDDPSKAIYFNRDRTVGIFMSFMSLEEYLRRTSSNEIGLRYYLEAYRFKATPKNAEKVHDRLARKFTSKIQSSDFMKFCIVKRGGEYVLEIDQAVDTGELIVHEFVVYREYKNYGFVHRASALFEMWLTYNNKNSVYDPDILDWDPTLWC